MRIAVIGTGMVGRTIAGKLSSLGHDVIVGTRDVAKTLSNTEGQAQYGIPAYSVWAKDHTSVRLETFSDAAAAGELIIVAVNGMGAIDALNAAGVQNLKGKILVDISNPLDFSKGMPPTLFVSNTDSLGEQIQRAFPECKVVKTLNTVNAYLMVDPGQLADGDHTMFVAGNDAEAKSWVTQRLKEWFGWKDVLDLGDISNARGTEMVLALWIRTWGVLQNPMFAFKIVR